MPQLQAITLKFIWNILFILSQIAARQLPCPGQTAHFQHYNEKQGLSQNTVTALYQDPLGFIWIGTEEGLNRFDGKEFRVYRHLRSDTNSLSNSNIRSIFPGNDGDIWIGTQYGLNRFDPKTERFERFILPGDYRPEAKNYVHDGIIDRRGFLWLGTYDGLFRLDPQTRKSLQFSENTTAPNGVNHNAVWKIFEDSDGLLWIGTSNGLNVLQNDDHFILEKYFHNPEDTHSISSSRVFDFAQTTDGTLWIATRDGLNKASGTPGKRRFTHYKNDPENRNSISSNFIWKMVADKSDQLWLASYNGGLNQLKWPVGQTAGLPQITRFQHDEKQNASIAHDEVNCVLRDHSGILWVGTAAGLDKMDPAGGRFQLIQNVPENPLSLHNSHVQALHFDRRGDLWIGTHGGGLHRLRAANLAAGKYEFEVFKHQPANQHSLSHNEVYHIFEDRYGYLWIATYDGLNYLHVPTGGQPKFGRFNVQDGLSHKFQYQVLQDRNQQHWVATYGRLNRMNFDPAHPENTKFIQYDMDPSRNNALVNATTYSMVEDRYGQLWTGTFNGISKLVAPEGAGSFENYLPRPGDPASLSNNFVKQLFLDSRGRLWAATRSGLNFIKQTAAKAPATFRAFGPDQGLPGEAVQSIAEDAEGRLWLGTSKGLAVFDPNIALGNSGVSPVLKCFDYRDGLQGNEFSERAAAVGPNGKLYFGGIHGLNIFDPKNLWENPYLPPLVFTEFRLFNKAVQPGFGTDNPLKQSITCTQSIALQYWQNVVGFRFAALSFSQPEKNQYAYKMEGFDEDWIFSGSDNAVTYTNLSPGRYRFLVKAANSDGLWNPNPIYINLRVLPPPWLSWWAFLIYTLSIGGGLYALYRFRLRQNIRVLEEKARIQQARFEEREYLRKQNAADFHDELGHRLTKIALALELAERQKTDAGALSSYLATARRHAAGLSSGIRDLIWSLDPKADSLFQTLVRLREFADGLFERSGIIFQATGIEENFENTRLEPDVRKQILLIFKEAMNNCLKYSQAKHCDFLAKKTAQTLLLQFSDDGQGFDPANTKQGYGLRNMQERAEKIGGKLMLESKPGKGTIVSLQIKIPQME